MGKENYKSAGVDIDAGNEAVNRIKDSVNSTFTSSVLTGLGGFGSLGYVFVFRLCFGDVSAMFW